MKLKKIASLALAGVMAVSMLAGCSVKPGTSNNGNVNVSVGATSVVDAANDGQKVENKVKVEFTSDAALEKALKTAVEMNGDGTAATLSTTLANLGVYENDTFFMANTSFDKDNDGKKLTKVYVKPFAALTEDAALNMIADDVNATVAGLDATSYKKGTTPLDGEYYDYSYTGKIAMVSSELSYGQTVYYCVYTIEQTVTAQKLEK